MLELLSGYIDAELPPEVCRKIEAHLAQCSPCAQFVRSLQGTVRLCKGYEADQRPSPLPDPARRNLLDAYRKALTSREGRSHPV